MTTRPGFTKKPTYWFNAMDWALITALGATLITGLISLG